MTDIDWTKFFQGPVSDAMWSAFKKLVFQSHLYSNHKDDAREDRRMARVRDPSSARAAKRIEREWQARARSNDSKWQRAEFLAHKALNQMAKIGSDGGSGSADWRFSIAMIKAVGSLVDQTKCDFSVTALRAIDVASLLALPENRIHEHLREFGRSKTTPSA